MVPMYGHCWAPSSFLISSISLITIQIYYNDENTLQMNGQFKINLYKNYKILFPSEHYKMSKKDHLKYKYMDEDEQKRRDSALISKLNQENRYLYQNVQLLMHENRQLRQMFKDNKHNHEYQHVEDIKKQDYSPTKGFNREQIIKQSVIINHKKVNREKERDLSGQNMKGTKAPTFIELLSESKFIRSTNKLNKSAERKGIQITTDRQRLKQTSVQRRKHQLSHQSSSIQKEQRLQRRQSPQQGAKKEYFYKDFLQNMEGARGQQKQREQVNKEMYMVKQQSKYKKISQRKDSQRPVNNNYIYKHINPQKSNISHQKVYQPNKNSTPNHSKRQLYFKKDNSPYLQMMSTQSKHLNYSKYIQETSLYPKKDEKIYTQVKKTQKRQHHHQSPSTSSYPSYLYP